MPLSRERILLEKIAKKPRSLVPSRHKMELASVRGCLGEMTRIYRLQLNGRVSTETASKMLGMLDRIRASVEALPPEPQFMQRGGPVFNIFSVQHERYLKQDTITRMANGEPVLGIAPGELLEPITIEHRSDATTSAPSLRLVPAPEIVDDTPIESLIESYSELSAGIDNESDPTA